jgi:MFS family permease
MMRLPVALAPSPRLAVSIYFFVTGFLSATWIARIPAMTNRLDLSAGRLGFILLAIAVGAIVSFSSASRTLPTRGSKWSTTVYGLFYVGTIPLVAIAWNEWFLVVFLAMYGFGFGATDVAMNAQGVEVEHAIRRNIIGSLHGYFSLGAMAGAGIAGVVAEIGIGLIPHFFALAALCLVALSYATTGLIDDRQLTPDADKEKPPRFVLPTRELWPLGIIAICAAVGEGGMADWSALYVHESLGKSEGAAAFAFTFFSLAMVIGRFLGDAVTQRFGNERVIRIGSGFAAVGYIAGILGGTYWSALAGYACLGIGIAVIFPVVYRMAGNAVGYPRGRAVAAVATVGYSAFLVAPPVLGMLADITSLQRSMLVIGVLTLAIVPFANATRAGAVDHSA